MSAGVKELLLEAVIVATSDAIGSCLEELPAIYMQDVNYGWYTGFRKGGIL